MEGLFGKAVAMRFWYGINSDAFVPVVFGVFEKNYPLRFALNPSLPTRFHASNTVFEILKVYGKWDTKRELKENYLLYINDYHKVEPEWIKSNGWMSPSGVFFPCEFGQHWDTAEYLSAQFYKMMYANKYDLFNRKWVKVWADGSCASIDERFLPLGVARGFRKLLKFGNRYYKINVENFLERLYLAHGKTYERMFEK